jgi:hypothetical protein
MANVSSSWTDVPTGDYQSFKRPDRPERYQDSEVLVLEDDPIVRFGDIDLGQFTQPH